MAMRQPFAYSPTETIILPLAESGESLQTRINFGLTPVSNGIFILYGGEDPTGRGSYSDLWNIRVHIADKDVHYTKA